MTVAWCILFQYEVKVIKNEYLNILRRFFDKKIVLDMPYPSLASFTSSVNSNSALISVFSVYPSVRAPGRMDKQPWTKMDKQPWTFGQIIN